MSLCALSGSVEDIVGNIQPGAVLEFRPLARRVVGRDGRVVFPCPRQATVGSDGEITISLWPGAYLVRGIEGICDAPEFALNVPEDMPTARLGDWIDADAPITPDLLRQAQEAAAAARVSQASALASELAADARATTATTAATTATTAATTATARANAAATSATAAANSASAAANSASAAAATAATMPATTAYIRTLLDDPDAATARATLGAAAEADVLRGGSGNIASGLWGAMAGVALLPAADPAIPTGGPPGGVLRFQAAASTTAELTPGERGSNSVTFAVAPGDRIAFEDLAWRTAGTTALLRISFYDAALTIIGASRNAAGTATDGAWHRLSGVETAPEGAASARVLAQATSASAAAPVFHGGLSIRRVTGWQAAAAVQRAAEDARLYGHLTPVTAGAFTLGTAAFPASEVRAVNGTIQTSDATLKAEALEPGTMLLLAQAFGTIQPRLYRWLSSIAEKGEAARVHIGPFAQDVEEAVSAVGLDPYRFGFLGKDAMTEEATRQKLGPGGEPLYDETQEPVMETVTVPVLDEAGEPRMIRSIRPDQLTSVALMALKFADDRRHAEIRAIRRTVAEASSWAAFKAAMGALDLDAEGMAGLMAAYGGGA